MRIRLLKPYQLAAAGEYLDPDPGVAAQLIARGIAANAEPPAPGKGQPARDPILKRSSGGQRRRRKRST